MFDLGVSHCHTIYKCAHFLKCSFKLSCIVSKLRPPTNSFLTFYGFFESCPPPPAVMTLAGVSLGAPGHNFTFMWTLDFFLPTPVQFGTNSKSGKSYFLTSKPSTSVSVFLCFVPVSLSFLLPTLLIQGLLCSLTYPGTHYTHQAKLKLQLSSCTL